MVMVMLMPVAEFGGPGVGGDDTGSKQVGELEGDEWGSKGVAGAIGASISLYPGGGGEKVVTEKELMVVMLIDGGDANSSGSVRRCWRW